MENKILNKTFNRYFITFFYNYLGDKIFRIILENDLEQIIYLDLGKEMIPIKEILEDKKIALSYLEKYKPVCEFVLNCKNKFREDDTTLLNKTKWFSFHETLYLFKE
jgi:hypothetical protein